MSQAPPSPDTPEQWGAASRGYAEHVAPVLMGPFVEAIADRLDLGQDAAVLEVGAGSGILTEVLARRAASVLATDFAPQMIEVLEARLSGSDKVRTAVMDGQALDLEDSSFDAAASSFALMLFPDRARGFAELCRVVRPGGRVAVTGWTAPDRFEAFGLFMAALEVAVPDLPPPPEPPPVFSLADPARFKSEMEAAGFRDVEVELVAREQELADFDQAWTMMTVGAPPVQVLFDRVGAAGRDRIRDALFGIIEERYAGGPFTLTNVATLGSGVAS